MKTSEISVRISSIKKLKMVNCYRLFGEEGPMYGILAYYQDQLINLCNADEHFEELLCRIAHVYDRESKESEIIADEETKRILMRANSFGEEQYEKMLAGFEEIMMPTVLPKAFSYVYLLPIVRYILKAMYDGQGDELVFQDKQNTWFGKGSLEAMLHGKRLCFPYRISSGSGECHEVTVGNFQREGNDLKFEFVYGYDGIAVSYYDKYFCYEGNLICNIKDGGVSLSHALKEKGKTKLHEERECEKREQARPGELLCRFAEGDALWEGFSLPWGGIAFDGSCGEEKYHVLTSEEDGMTVSHAICFCNLTAKEEGPMPFGRYHVCLYERNDITELHLLGMAYPRSGCYQEQYAGRYYTLRAGKERQNGELSHG